MALDKEFKDIPGTIVFDAEQSRKGYWLNQFCMSLMKAENRARFKANERAYLDEWKMTEEQKQAVLDRDLNRMMALGGNIYFLVEDRRDRRQELPADGGLDDRHERGRVPQDDGQRRPQDRRKPQDRRGRRRPASPEGLTVPRLLIDFKDMSNMARITASLYTSHIPAVGAAFDLARRRRTTGSRCSPDTTSTSNG